MFALTREPERVRDIANTVVSFSGDSDVRLLNAKRFIRTKKKKKVLTINSLPQSFRVAFLYFNVNASHCAPGPTSSIIKWMRHIQLYSLSVHFLFQSLTHCCVFFTLFHSAHFVTNISYSIVKWDCHLWFCLREEKKRKDVDRLIFLIITSQWNALCPSCIWIF